MRSPSKRIVGLKSKPKISVYVWFDSFYVRVSMMTAEHGDGRSQIKADTDERTQDHSARSSLTVTLPSTNRGRRCLTSVNVPLG